MWIIFENYILIINPEFLFLLYKFENKIYKFNIFNSIGFQI